MSIDVDPRPHPSTEAVAPHGSVVTFASDLERHGDRVALIDGDGTPISYVDLAARADHVARRLDDVLGHERGLVAITAEADVPTVVGYLGALRAGHVVLLVPPGDEGPRARLLDAWQPGAKIEDHDDHGEPVVHELTGEASALHPDLALLLSTSGSTGSPKLVRLSHASVQSNADAIASYLGLTADDRAAMSLPLHYCYGLSVVHSHLAVGAGVVMAGGSVVDRCFWDRFRRHGCTSFAGVPHTFELLDRAGLTVDAPTLRYVTQAGGRMGPQAVRRWTETGRDAGWDLFVMYGQTEATARMAYLPPDLAASHPNSIGRAIPGGSLRVEPLDGTTGELVYSGPNVMLGYATTPADLARGRDVDELRTGDLARVDADGLFEIVGRVSRFAKLFGVRVDLDHVERLLTDRGLDALCTGTDDHLAIAIAGDGDVSTVELATEIAQELRLPIGVVGVTSVDQLPRLANGKPDRAAVARLAERAPERPAGGGRTVREVYAEVLHVDEVGLDDTFVGLGGDSLSYVEVSLLLEHVIGDLPEGWHTAPVRELEARGGTRKRWRSVEGNVALRALAVVFVVGTHASLYRIQGGAHLLLAVAGFNFARFRLTATEAADRVRRAVGSMARIWVPAVLWVCFMFTWREPFTVPRVLLVDNVFGDGLWRYWYIEVLLQLLVVLMIVFGIGSLRDAERRRPFAFAMALLVGALAVRYGMTPWGLPEEPMYRTDTAAWLFLVGWAAARANQPAQKAAVTIAAVVAVPGFFDSAGRGLVVALGLLALVWIPRIRLPRPVNRAVAAIAGASLYIFLTHFAVLPWLRPHVPAWALLASALAVGITVDAVAQRVRPVEWFHRRRPRSMATSAR